MIRQATIADLPKMETRAREFFAASKYLGEFDIEGFTESWTVLFNIGGVIFVAEQDGQLVGAIGALIHPEMYGKKGQKRIIAEELFWFVGAEYRRTGVALYREFERWALAGGASELQMVHLLDSMPDKVARFYEHEGYAAAETRYIKRVKCT